MKPLDPSKVKAGDTVTLSLEGSHVTDVVASWEHNPASDHYRAYLTHDPDPFDAKPFRLVGNTAYSLTDHQPAPEPVDERIEAWERVAQHPVFTSAYDGEGPLLDSMMAVLDRIAHQPAPTPEPEPEWKPGTVALISTGYEPDVMASRLYDGAAPWRSLSGYHHWTDEQINSVRPLVVIDPAAVDVDALAAAIRKAEETGGPFTATTKRLAYAALAHLGIEAS